MAAFQSVYLSYWFPARRRAQMLGFFTTAIWVASILGGILGGWIMGSTGGRNPTGSGTALPH